MPRWVRVIGVRISNQVHQFTWMSVTDADVKETSQSGAGFDDAVIVMYFLFLC